MSVKEIEKIKKNIEDIIDDYDKDKKKLYPLYKKLFDKKHLKTNKDVCIDLFNAGNLIYDWFPEDKKIGKEYFNQAISLAKDFENMSRLGKQLSRAGEEALSKKVLNQSKPLAKTFSEKWDLADCYKQAGFSDLAKKTAQEAIKTLKKPEDIEKWTEELERLMDTH